MLSTTTPTLEFRQEQAVGNLELSRFVAWYEKCVFRAKQMRNAGLPAERRVFAETMMVTPQICEWLLDNKQWRNRKIRQRSINTLTDSIGSDRFVMTGETVIINVDGNINDGQHRLHACVVSGRTIYILFAFGVDKEAQDVTDTGEARTAGEQLGLDDVPYPNNVAAAARLLLMIEKGANSYKGRCGKKVTTDLIKGYIESNPKLKTAVADAAPVGGALKTTPTTIGAALFLIITKTAYQKHVDEFFSLLKEGGDTGYVGLLRDLLLKKDKGYFGFPSSVDKSFSQIATIISAWNKFAKMRAGRTKTPKSRFTIDRWAGGSELPNVE